MGSYQNRAKCLNLGVKKDQICRIKSLFQVHWTYQMHGTDFRALYTVVSRSVGLTLLFQVSKHML